MKDLVGAIVAKIMGRVRSLRIERTMCKHGKQMFEKPAASGPEPSGASANAGSLWRGHVFFQNKTSYLIFSDRVSTYSATLTHCA